MRIAILTSGGDAPGMNPAIRAVAKCARRAGAEVLAVREGYDGLVNGWITPLGPTDVSGLLDQGGTVLGTARSEVFRTLDGRRDAVLQLVRARVDRLIVIGGDGSLTGASTLAREWSDHVARLVEDGAIDATAAPARLHVVGLVGSIDNDFAGTDATIGGDSALHRVVEAIDALTSTASSHQRSFVVEVMGRHCGWLALAAAIATGADYALLPEAPPADWRAAVLGAIAAGRDAGRRHAVVIVAEGARDAAGSPIPASAVRDAIRDDLGLDTRVTVLGHVQRGGAPSAYDRVMTTVLGARAASAAVDGPIRPVVLGTAGPDVVVQQLDDAVARSRAAGAAVTEGRHADALAQREPGFRALLVLRDRTSRPCPTPPDGAPAILIAHVGAPAPGMNAAVAAAARAALGRGHRALAAHEGLRGLATGDVQALDWPSVDGWVGRGGAMLGTNREVPPTAVLLAALGALGVRGVVLIGGFEALEVAAALGSADLPVAVVPATISSNVTGSWRSIGSDTACNAVLEACDRLRQSAVGARDRVFVVEVMGRRCGALAATSALGAGAELVFTHEDDIGIDAIRSASSALNASFDAGRAVGLVLVADGVEPPYAARGVAAMLEAESGGRFDARLCVLGHLQQGGRPSPADRIDGARLGAAAADHAIDGVGACVVGLRGGDVAATPVDGALAAADRRLRRAKRPDHAGVLGLARALGVEGG
jgi:6-phosphofructokinase 1